MILDERREEDTYNVKDLLKEKINRGSIKKERRTSIDNIQLVPGAVQESKTLESIARMS